MKRRSAILLPYLLVPLSCTPGPDDPCSSGLADAVDGTSISIPERSAFDPDVVIEDDAYVLYLGSVILGDGGLYRTTSADGVQWTEPTRVFEAYDASVVRHNGEYQMVYTTRFQGEGEVIGPRTRFGHAVSEDGIEWSDNGVVFAGPGEGQEGDTPLAVEEIHRPLLWVEDDEYHLLYLGYEARAIEDIGYAVQVLGYAKGPELAQLKHVAWLKVPERCVDGDSAELTLFQRVRAGCQGCGAVHGFIAKVGDCGGGDPHHELIYPVESDVATQTVDDVASEQGVAITYLASTVSFEGSYADGAKTTLRIRSSMFGCDILE